MTARIVAAESHFDPDTGEARLAHYAVRNGKSGAMFNMDEDGTFIFTDRR